MIKKKKKLERKKRKKNTIKKKKKKKNEKARACDKERAIQKETEKITNETTR